MYKIFNVILLLISFNVLSDNILKVGDVEVDISTLKSTKDIAKQLCSGCHGDNGYGDRFYGPDSHFGTPSISGFNNNYFIRQMNNFKSKTRETEHSHEMNNIMAYDFFTKDIIEDLSKYYKKLPAPALQVDAEQKISPQLKPLFLRGKKLYVEKTCISCHGENGKGIASNDYPYLLGQNAIYTQQMLHYFQGITAPKSGKPLDFQINIMHNITILNQLSDKDIKDLSIYLENSGGVR